MLPLENLTHTPGEARDPCRPRLASPLIGAQRRDDITAPRQGGRQRDCILDRLTRTLAQVRRHRVGRVTEQRHPPHAPPVHRLAVQDVVTQDLRLRRGGQQRLDRLPPPGESLLQIRLAAHGGSISPAGSLAVAHQ